MDTGGTRAAAGPAARPTDGDAAPGRRRLTRLGVEVGRLRTRLASVQAELHALRGIEAGRPLGADETRRVTRLRLESQGLQLELAALREEFARLRDERRSGPGTVG